MSPADDGERWTGEPLPRGRHKLGREAVRASQRERLLRAMEELVGDRGYEATTVPLVVAAARVSSNTFYGLFTDKADCFIALCEVHGDELLAALLAGGGPPASREEALGALDRGIDVYLRWWRDRPRIARAYFLELPLAGERAIAERDRQYERFAALHRAIGEGARAVQPGLAPLRDIDVTAAVIVITEIVAREIRAGRLEQLGDLHGELRHLLLKLLVGPPSDWAGARA
jgi:AcrR family transcriptional regulator